MNRRLIAWSLLAATVPTTGFLLIGSTGPEIDAEVTAKAGDEASGRSAVLATARRSYRIEDLDNFIAAQQTILSADPQDADGWRVLAEAYLERLFTRSADRGMRIGTPTYSELPATHRADIKAGLEAVEQAKRLAPDTGDTFRIEACLLAQQITGPLSAWQLNNKATAAISQATQLDPTNPRVHVAIGCRKLFAPKLLGQDPVAAQRLLLGAAAVLPLDERPLCFAALCAFLTGEPTKAEHLLEMTIERNPNNRFAREVLRRIRAGEAEPFARDRRDALRRRGSLSPRWSDRQFLPRPWNRPRRGTLDPARARPGSAPRPANGPG